MMRDTRIVFGHWSTLGRWNADGVIALDSGCLWGGKLTAVRLDTETPPFTEVECPQLRAPSNADEIAG
jgi:bis(5'-nucleosyl)-tetraphosphatase (symmetrical)